MRSAVELNSTSPKTLLKTLRRRQNKHSELLAKVEKTAARLDRQRLKLQTLESKIADIERRVSDPHRRKTGTAPGAGRMRKALLIFNPSSGREGKDSAERLSKVVSALRGHGIEARIGLKTSGKLARTLAQRAVRRREPLVLVAAGDGTIEDVASQLVGSDTVLGIIPIGTMNNLARSLGVPLDIEDACALVGMGTTRLIDVGQVFANGRPHVQHFLEGAGVGLSAIAAYAGQTLEKRRWQFLRRALRQLFEQRPGVIQVQLDDTLIETSSNIVTVSNSPLMGSNLLVAPEAKMDDGMLDVAIYDGLNGADLIQHFMIAGKGEADDLKIYRAKQVRITADAPIASNSDKDVVSKRCVIEIGILSKALSVIAGNGIGLTVPVEAAPPAPPINGDPPVTNGQAESRAVEQAVARG
jgi:YegS/Rv2252/BmrU family lipid kinase